MSKLEQLRNELATHGKTCSCAHKKMCEDREEWLIAEIKSQVEAQGSASAQCGYCQAGYHERCTRVYLPDRADLCACACQVSKHQVEGEAQGSEFIQHESEWKRAIPEEEQRELEVEAGACLESIESPRPAPEEAHERIWITWPEDIEDRWYFTEGPQVSRRFEFIEYRRVAQESSVQPETPQPCSDKKRITIRCNLCGAIWKNNHRCAESSVQPETKAVTPSTRQLLAELIAIIHEGHAHLRPCKLAYCKQSLCMEVLAIIDAEEEKDAQPS